MDKPLDGAEGETPLPEIGPFRPEIDSDKCLLATTAFSRCRACADACPTEAILCDDEGLGIDEAACIGCGLCVPACPERAIGGAVEPQLRRFSRSNSVFLACEKALADDKADYGQDRIPCLHMLGVTDLEAIRYKGAELLVLACGDCASCLPVRSIDFGKTSQLFDALMTSRELKTPATHFIEVSAWRRARAEAEELGPGRAVNRRGFLQILSAPAENALGETGAQRGAFGLPVRSTGDIVLCRPAIDAQKCTACDACINVCPHEALALIRAEGASGYRISAAACNGCRLCVDICKDSAIIVDGPGRAMEATLQLHRFQCRKCGVPGHRVTDPGTDSLCRVCEQTIQRQKLFQIQN